MIDLGINLFQEIAALGGGGGGYSISNSLRFNNDDSAYLTRTPASAGNRKTWTWSGWVKFGGLSETFPRLFSTGTDANNRTEILFITSTNQIRFLSTVGGVSRGVIDTNASLRDASGWYHLVISLNASATTLSVYINGVQQTLAVTTAIANVDHMINATNAHNIGRYFGSGNHFDGYLSEVNFIDGQALTADDFGEINATTGEWVPKAYEGTYGTNGFYLEFKDGAALGDDTSGNTNDWTPVNLASTDQMLDTPTNNFSTLNPLRKPTYATLSDGNLVATTTGSQNVWNFASTIGLPVNQGGKFIFEATLGTLEGATTLTGMGFITQDQSPNSATHSSSDCVVAYFCGGSKTVAGVNSAYGATYTTNDVITCAIDITNDSAEFFKNGVSQGTITSLGLNSSDTLFAFVGNNQSSVDGSWSLVNFGQLDFTYTPPAGFLALCADNLPEPTIVDSETQFNVVTYTGTGSPRSITGVGFEPDFVWIKGRSDPADYHFLFDVVRGPDKVLKSNATDAEYFGGGTGYFPSFDSDGFSLTGNGLVNGNTNTYVAWCWKAGGTAVTNTDGSITSQVSANVDAGFSIVGYTGTGAAATIGHGLSSAPDMIIVKNRDYAVLWVVYHSSNTSAPETEALILNSTDATVDNNTVWNDTAPTSSVFSVETSLATNQLNDKHIAYCFHSVEGFSKFGSYVGNGSADGPFVYTGFRPAFVMIKRTDSSDEWAMHDSARPSYNPANLRLLANGSGAELSTQPIDLTANGFKVRSTAPSHNASGGTYIYMAFAEAPFKNAVAR